MLQHLVDMPGIQMNMEEVEVLARCLPWTKIRHFNFLRTLNCNGIEATSAIGNATSLPHYPLNCADCFNDLDREHVFSEILPLTHIAVVEGTYCMCSSLLF